MKIELLISGGQTGADIGGLKAAKKLKIKTGGMAPKGYKTENGNNIELKDIYGLDESVTNDYKHRTICNIQNSDGTVLFMEKYSGGSILTMNECKKNHKPFLICPNDIDFNFWLKKNKIKILNVAGNRESVSLGIEKRVFDFLLKNLK